MRPCASTGTFVTRVRPKPSIPSALVTLGCTSSLTITVTGGAPNMPSASTFQPARSSTVCLAAASAVKLATVAPVTNAPPHPAGSPNSSTSQLSAVCSMTASAGVTACRAVFWSQAVASQFAARATGSEPPMTNPKNRGPAIATDAGEPTSSSRASVSCGSLGCPGNGPASRSTPATAAADGATERASSPSR